MDRVRVLVERGSHAKVPAEVFDYELPVLSELHTGVTEVSRAPYTLAADTEFDVGDAYRALKLKYNQPDAAEALNAVYPNESVFARALKANESQPKKRAA